MKFVVPRLNSNESVGGKNDGTPMDVRSLDLHRDSLGDCENVFN
jgi:hypothetical protein